MPLYRVTFIHARHRATFEVLIRAPTPVDAQDLAGLVVAPGLVVTRKCWETVGPDGDWRHQETSEVEEPAGAQDGHKKKLDMAARHHHHGGGKEIP